MTNSSAADFPEPPVGAERHPRGLYTLFFTEMWERFSYYGMRALLVLFMVDAVEKGGLGMTDESATAIYGLYTAAVYLAALPGGWIADRLLGAQRSVWLGGLIIALGHFTLAIPQTSSFYLGLMLVVMGTGLLKPNISAIVGSLYPEGGARRDAGFTIFYMGINLGAALGPLICSYLGESERFGWHYGFGAAGVGMVLGVIQFKLSAPFLGDAGRLPGRGENPLRRDWYLLWFGLAIAAVVAMLAFSGALHLDPTKIAAHTTYLIVSLAVIYFVCVFSFFGLSVTEKKRMAVIVVLFLGAAMFWSGFEQAGSSLNLFADRYTDRTFFSTDKVIPAGWFQSLNPFFVITLAPVLASLWMMLGRRGLNPPLPVKFALGFLLLAVGFLLMVGASSLVQSGDRVWPTWLIFTYLFHTLGELCLSPVGLSAVTKLSPPRLVGQMMGVWFLAASLGNLIAGILAGEFNSDAVDSMPRLYLQIVMTSFGSGVLLLLFTKPIRRLMSGVR